MSYSIFDLWSAKHVEPKKRMVGGEYGYAIHRFPVKGGIRLNDAMLETFRSIEPTETPFMARLRQQSKAG